MPKKLNVRQQELRDQMKAMLNLAVTRSEDEELGYYMKEIDREEFLVFFGVVHCAGEYARKRYFKDFVQFGVFLDLGNGKFKVDYEQTRKLATIYGVKSIPEPKSSEQQKLGVKQP